MFFSVHIAAVETDYVCFVQPGASKVPERIGFNVVRLLPSRFSV
jgi:hypothetical protein